MSIQAGINQTTQSVFNSIFGVKGARYLDMASKVKELESERLKHLKTIENWEKEYDENINIIGEQQEDIEGLENEIAEVKFDRDVAQYEAEEWRHDYEAQQSLITALKPQVEQANRFKQHLGELMSNRQRKHINYELTKQGYEKDYIPKGGKA